MAKRNKMLRKVLVTMCSAVLLVGATVGVTVAYLTSTTQVVKNTFTIGNVAITLDEALVDEYGEKQGEERTEDGNEYRLVPKHTYVKDPTVTVKKDSDEAYVRVLVTVNNRAYLDELFATRGYSLETVIGGYDPTLWELASNKIKEDDDDSRVYEFRYIGTDKDTVTALTGDVELAPVFTEIIVPETVTNSDLEKLVEFKIDVVAHAIQADGFADADAAWGAWGE